MMVRLRPKAERPIKIFTEVEGQPTMVATINALNLPDAIRRWYDSERGRFVEPQFQANTVTVRSVTGDNDFTYWATD